MVEIGYKFVGVFVALVVLAATVVCPCAVGIFGAPGQARAVMSCCEQPRDAGKPGKDLGGGKGGEEGTCKAFCATRVLEISKNVSVNLSPSQLVGVLALSIDVPAGAVVQARPVSREFELPHSSVNSLLRLHCALLV